MIKIKNHDLVEKSRKSNTSYLVYSLSIHNREGNRPHRKTNLTLNSYCILSSEKLVYFEVVGVENFQFAVGTYDQ